MRRLSEVIAARNMGARRKDLNPEPQASLRFRKEPSG